MTQGEDMDRGIILASIAFACARQLVRGSPAPKTPGRMVKG